MAHFRNDFFLVWGLLIVLVLLGEGFQVLATLGFEDLNAFAEFLIPRVLGIGLLSAVFAYFRPFFSFSRPNRSRKSNDESESTTKKLVLKRVNRVTHCYKCKRTLEAYTGVNCQNCGWIRCPCGACNC